MDVLFIFGCGVLVMYLFMGLAINILIFLWSKMKGMDRIEEKWDMIINSLSGFFYFLISGMIFWLPVTLMFFLERQKINRKKEDQLNKDETDLEEVYEGSSVWRFIRHPYQSYRSWFYEYYE